MFKKIIKPLIVALIFYVITVLYGLISFHPLPVVFYRGIKAFLIGFFLSLLLKIILQYFNNNLENQENKMNEYDKEKVTAKYNKSDKDDKDSEGDEQNEQKKEKDFNPLDPPVLETEKD